MENIFLLKQGDGSLTECSEIEGLKIDFLGVGSKVILEEGSIFFNVKIKLSDSSLIIIEKTAARGIRNTVVDMAGSSNSFLSIKKGFSIESGHFAMANESNISIEIGEDCLFSSHIIFRGTDGHPIFDMKTKKILNITKPITIGNHVWLGSNVVILKGTNILNNSVVGTGSIVAKKFIEENIIIAGNPAQTIKRNINWDRSYIDNYQKEH